MLNTALSIENPNHPENQSLIDELNSAVATGGEKQRLRILERVTDLFAGGARGYSSDQIALFDDVLQALAAEIEVKARARLAHAFERYKKLSQDTARNIINFYGRRIKHRMQKNGPHRKNKVAEAQPHRS